MPLGRCNACLNKLALGSRTCARCGAKKNRTKMLLIVVIMGQVVLIGAFVSLKHDKSPDVIRQADDNDVSIVDSPPRDDQAKAPAGWLYFDTHDSTMGDTMHHARLLSRGVAESNAPHNIGTTGVMELQSSRIYGRAVVFTLRRAAFDSVADTCEIDAQFDFGDTGRYTASCSADTSRAIIALLDPKPFTDRLTGARTVSIVAKLALRSERSIAFEVFGLKWD